MPSQTDKAAVDSVSILRPPQHTCWGPPRVANRDILTSEIAVDEGNVVNLKSASVNRKGLVDTQDCRIAVEHVVAHDCCVVPVWQPKGAPGVDSVHWLTLLCPYLDYSMPFRLAEG